MAANFSTKNESIKSGKGAENFAMPEQKAPTLNNKFSKESPTKAYLHQAAVAAENADDGGGVAAFSWFLGSSTTSNSASTHAAASVSASAPALKHPPPKKRDPTAKKELQKAEGCPGQDEGKQMIQFDLYNVHNI